jgi:hypothetical protein
VANDKQKGTNTCGPISSCDLSLTVVAGSGESDGVFTCNDSECENSPFGPPSNPLDPSNYYENNICDYLPYAPPCSYID